MKRWGWLALAACVVVAGCDDDNGTAPTNRPVVLTAQLSAANEVPPVANAESGARGAVQVTMIPTRDSTGAITAATADFHIQMVGLPENTAFVGAHIHPGVAGVNGPVVLNTSLSAGTRPTIVSGAASWDFRGINVPAATAQQLESDPSAFYFNVHSLTNPGGVARGQLSRAQ
jgi:hypothetical protein